MSLSYEEEHPPLLPIGRHTLTLAELRALCVDRFPDSETRERIMTGLEQVIGRIEDAGIQVDVWINGSFLTEKRDPNDSDIALRISSSVAETLSEEQESVLAWVKSNLKNKLYCDSYIFFVYPNDDSRADFGKWMEAYWTRQFGFSRGDNVKGIAVVQTGVGT